MDTLFEKFRLFRKGWCYLENLEILCALIDNRKFREIKKWSHIYNWNFKDFKIIFCTQLNVELFDIIIKIII